MCYLGRQYIQTSMTFSVSIYKQQRFYQSYNNRPAFYTRQSWRLEYQPISHEIIFPKCGYKGHVVPRQAGGRRVRGRVRGERGSRPCPVVTLRPWSRSRASRSDAPVLLPPSPFHPARALCSPTLPTLASAKFNLLSPAKWVDAQFKRSKNIVGNWDEILYLNFVEMKFGNKMR